MLQRAGPVGGSEGMGTTQTVLRAFPFPIHPDYPVVDTICGHRCKNLREIGQATLAFLQLRRSTDLTYSLVVRGGDHDAAVRIALKLLVHARQRYKAGLAWRERAAAAAAADSAAGEGPKRTEPSTEPSTDHVDR